MSFFEVAILEITIQFFKFVWEILPNGSTKDPHTALLGGHSTPNTVVLGEGMSEYRVPPLLRLPELLL